jgi:broad specificity phosphatase PhoE
VKEVVVIRHGHWDLVNDRLTEQGKGRCLDVKPTLGSFVIAISSPLGRTQETAELLSDVEPKTDERASVPQIPQEFRPRAAELRKTHPEGVAGGALFSIPELREPLHKQGQALLELVKETLAQLPEGQRALIVSHDGTMVGMEKVLTGATFDEIDHTYGELEGFRIDGSMHLTGYEPLSSSGSRIV